MELMRKRIGSYANKITDVFYTEQVTEIIVPDTNPDYENTISVFATCKLNEKSLLSGNIKINGQIFLTIHYSSNASECAYTINYTDSFSHTEKCVNIDPEDKLICSTEVVGAEISVINSRKIRLTTKLCSRYQIFHLYNTEIIEDICEDIGEGIKTLTGTSLISACVDITEKQLNISEEIHLNNAESSLSYRIVRWNSNWIINDKKVMQNRVMLRGHIEIDVYSTPEHEFIMTCKRYTIPFSQIIDCKNSFDEDIIECYFKQTHCNIKLKDKEDGVVLSCDCFADAVIFSERKINLKYLQDAYSTEYALDCKNISYTFNEQSEIVSKEYCIEGRIDFKDFINQIIDCSATTSYKKSTDNTMINIYVSANIIYLDNSNCISNVGGNFEYSIDVDPQLLDYSIEIIPESIQATIDPSGILLTNKGKCSYKTITVKEVSTMVSCSIDKTKKNIKNRKANLIIRSVNEEETVWSIAKQYSTSIDSIISANELTDGILTKGKLLMIPLFK